MRKCLCLFGVVFDIYNLVITFISSSTSPLFFIFPTWYQSIYNFGRRKASVSNRLPKILLFYDFSFLFSSDFCGIASFLSNHSDNTVILTDYSSSVCLISFDNFSVTMPLSNDCLMPMSIAKDCFGNTTFPLGECSNSIGDLSCNFCNDIALFWSIFASFVWEIKEKL